MVLELFPKALFSVIDLLRGSLFLAIIVLIIVFLASFFFEWLSKKYSFTWLKATLLTSYLTIFILIMLLYCLPVFSGFSEANQGVLPANFEMAPIEWVIFILQIIIRNIAIAAIIAILLLPMEFFASFVFDFLKQKYKFNKWANIFLAVFATTILSSFICLFLLPQIITGTLYLVFYWHL